MADQTPFATGWYPIALTPDAAHLYGLPAATRGYRRLVHDGALVALVAHTDNGSALAVTHLAHYDPLTAVPGRMPTLVEVYAARRVLIPDEPLMVLILEPMSYALKLRWQRTHQDFTPPPAPGLPTTVKCVQMYVEAITEDVVFGTEDIATPAPATVWPVPPPIPAGPVGPVPDELLGDAELATLEEEDDDPDPEF